MFDTPVLPRLDTILSEVKSGELIIPWFQRPFVWDDERRLNLLDSIVYGMPIGSLLVWRTNKRELRTYESLGGVRLDGPRKGDEKLSYLIDGHQRISTLFGALYSGDRDAPTTVDNTDETRWPLYYELGEVERPAFRIPPRRRAIPANWIPLSILLNGDKLFEFTQGLREKNKRDQAKEAERLANVFRDYIIPIVPLVTESLSVVTDAFVRINSQGKGMSEAHMLRALTHLGTVDTDTHFTRVRSSLEPLGWAELDDQVLVNVLKAQLDLDVYESDVRGLHDKLKEDSKPVERLADVIQEAVEFLATVGVRGPGALPYIYQLVTLATLAAWSPGILSRRDNQKYVHDWFWISTYTELFSGITGSRIKEVIHQLYNALTNSSKRGRPLANEVNVVKPLTEIRGSTGRTKAFLLFLAQLPRKQKARQKRQERLGAADNRNTPSLLPIAGGSDIGNRVIADPAELRALRSAIKAGSISGAMGQEFGIPADARAALPNQRAFLDERGKTLVSQEEKFLERFGLRIGESE